VEVVIVAISALGLLFAAIAAWGAVEAVAITRQTQHEADIRRVIEALFQSLSLSSVRKRTGR
jgi:hypothetical protein